MKAIKKAVIPAAGLGTHFLPASKAIAKEMMPVLDKPVIQFIVDELIDSGIEEILIITGRAKRSIEDHFDANFELEDSLEEKGKTELLELVHQTTRTNIQFKRQAHPLGLGDAVGLAKSFAGEDPFVLALGDVIVAKQKEPASKSLIERAEKLDRPMVMVNEVPVEEAHHYGLVSEGEEIQKGVYKVTALVEKPEEVNEHPVVLSGRYVLTSDIFDYLDHLKANEASKEIELTDALNDYIKENDLYSYHCEERWFEVGEPLGLTKASIQYALHVSEIKDEARAYLKDLVKELKEKKA